MLKTTGIDVQDEQASDKKDGFNLIFFHHNMLLFRDVQTIERSINRQSISATQNLLSICGMSPMVK